MYPEWVGELLGEMAQVNDVSSQQAEQHERLTPLRRVAPEHPDVFDQQRADIHRHAGQQAGGAFDGAAGITETALSPLPSAEPGPLPEHVSAALHGGNRLVEQ